MPQLTILADTSSVWGLANSKDHWHNLATAEHAQISRSAAKFVISRIAWIECFGHASRLKPRDKSMIANFRTLPVQTIESWNWPIEEHAADDFAQAREWWLNAKVAMDLPDLLTAATALRLGYRVWTYDQLLMQFLAEHGSPAPLD